MSKGINKKIKNATKNNSFGIEFKSQLEATVYKVLKEQGFNPEYEKRTFELAPKLRPSIPFYKRVNKVFGLEIKPLQPITYTPDFTFKYNDILVIIEVKGFENDVYPVKRNLFRRQLETMNASVIFFEIRTKKELLQAIQIIKNESELVVKVRKLLPKLPEKDIAKANKLLEIRDWKKLQNLVSLILHRIEKSWLKYENKYNNVDTKYLLELQALIDSIWK